MSADECDEPDTVAHAGEENVIEAEKDSEIEDEGKVEMRAVSDDGNEQLEDGELEDGEIDDEPAETGTDIQKESVENLDEVQQDDKPKSSKKDKRKRKRSKRDKSQEGDARKRSKKKRYVDHDRINDEDDMTWIGEQEHSNRRQKKYTDHDNMGNGGHSPTGDLYDSPYDSPPGLYDSPSDGEGDDRGPISMLGLVQDDFMDVSISAQEKQSVDMEKGSKRLSRKKHKSKQSEGRGSKHCSRKTPLVELPRSERPQCKFFKEGKCQKGSSCPFNHDFQPEKRNDVCKFYLTSACNRENCLFMHNILLIIGSHDGSVSRALAR
ncbi:zinc finger CCCH domain-containing protein 6-like [Patella vulgata]|uniref:zinc finger CCCH domain-containing protein 6-like n=1 Tax=Patella vulgata TaxID=6465 RepID=UPI0024A930D2|nr:zinc finger CCCH domain-containing protein 6-like [Patella vulgata]